ncbi:MAG: 1-acyl-sn-glycerol-3-phosphate acyltransferase [Bacteroidales bacterium]|jgi:1-acyl-sn-glycerol-3-phosphate acyltransferase
MRVISGMILRLLGWKVTAKLPPDLKKCVIVAAPHTSNQDFFIGRLAYFTLGTPVKFLIKKESFQNPLGGLLKKAGGIPVDRGKANNLVEDIASLFGKHEVMNVIITPEGTRKLVKNWKRGFYYIALKAKVPIILGYIDYKTKTTGFGPILYPTGNFEADFEIIENFYRTKTAKFPELFNLSPVNKPIN